MTAQLRMLDDSATEPSQWERVLTVWRVGLKSKTVSAYAGDLRAFADWCGQADGEAALRSIAGLDAGEAGLQLAEWMDWQAEAGFSVGTIRRRVSAVRSVLRLASGFGLVAWREVELTLPPLSRSRDVRGPAPEDVRAALSESAARAATGDRIAVRDYAIMRLLCDVGLRIGSVMGADLSGLDGNQLRVPLKGRGERWTVKTLPPATLDAVRAWVDARGQEPGPLFVGSMGGQRLTGKELYRIVSRHGFSHPHVLRHYAITQVVRWLAEHGRPLTDALAFSDHASVATLQVYYDQVRDAGGELSAALAERNG